MTLLLDELYLARNAQINALLLEHAASSPQDLPQQIELQRRQRHGVLTREIRDALARIFVHVPTLVQLDRSRRAAELEELFVKPIPHFVWVRLAIREDLVAANRDQEAALN